MRLSILASIFVGSSIAAAAHAAGPAAADVGDADSFGRNVHFIGTSQSGSVSVTSDASNCPPPDPSLPDDRCLVVNPAPAQTVATFNDIGRIKLPAKATNSLLCHAVTPFFFWHASNPTGSTKRRRLMAPPSATGTPSMPCRALTSHDRTPDTSPTVPRHRRDRPPEHGSGRKSLSSGSV